MNDQAPEQSADPTEALLEALNDAPEQEEPSEEVEAQAEEAPDEEPEAEEEPKPEVSQKFRVKVKNDSGEDEERDLSLEELAAGYMQSADYTRKTQAVAQQEKQRQEQFFQAVQTTAQQAQQQLAALHQMVIASAAPELQNVNWQQVAMEDPARYVQLQAKQQQLNQVLGTLQQQHQQLEQQKQSAIAQQRDQAMKQSLDYLSREIPGFNLEKSAKELKDAGKRYGFSDEELGTVIDGRFIHLLHDAAKWRELQTAKPKAMQKVAEAPKVLKPSAPQPKKQNASALDRLKKTGRAEELMNFL
jgi:hypothetical protein